MVLGVTNIKRSLCEFDRRLQARLPTKVRVPLMVQNVSFIPLSANSRVLHIRV